MSDKQCFCQNNNDNDPNSDRTVLAVLALDTLVDVTKIEPLLFQTCHPRGTVFASISIANINGCQLSSVYLKRPMIMTPTVTVTALVLATVGDVNHYYLSHATQEVAKASTTFVSINFPNVNGT
jgi:hypothetical protein